MADDKKLDQLFNLRASFPTEEETAAFFKAARANDLQALDKILEKWPLAAAKWHSGDDAVIARSIDELAPKTLDYLVGRGADINDFGVDKFWSALLYAAFAGKAVNIEKLLRAGAEIDAANKHDKTPLMYAAEKCKLDCVDLLVLLGADPERRDATGKSALDLAANEDVREVIAAAQKRRADFLAASPPRAEEPAPTPEETCIRLLSLLQLKKPESEPPPAPPEKKPWYKIGG